MNERQISKAVKIGVKSPSSDFTPKIMEKIYSLNQRTSKENKWFFRTGIYACWILLFLSIFINIPEIQFFNYSIGFSPAFMPILSLIVIFFVLKKCYQIRDLIRQNLKNKSFTQSL
ncbi:MAG: hypothetical protein VW127_04275 [Flavobacteriaceae bacterium]|jgi:hypothetical protein